MTPTPNNKQTLRIIEGARAYALSDRSDPFAFSRAISHFHSGISGLHPDGTDAFYDAKPGKEIRITVKGEKYEVEVFREIQRP